MMLESTAPTFRDPRSVAPLPLYFPYHLVQSQNYDGNRISTLPKWFLKRTLRLPELSLSQHTGLAAALRAELGFRTMSSDQHRRGY